MKSASENLSDERLKRLDKLAVVLDSRFTIPGTKIRFGLDALLGLAPGIGDAVGALISLWIVYSGWRMGATRATSFRMLGNVGLELVLGFVPIVGDLFDVVWRANNRNIELLRQELAPDQEDRKQELNSGQQNLLAILALIILIGLIMSALGYR